MGRTFAAVIHGQSLRGVECGLNPYLLGSGSQKVRPCGGVRGKGVTRGVCAQCRDLQKGQWPPGQGGVAHGPYLAEEPCGKKAQNGGWGITVARQRARR